MNNYLVIKVGQSLLIVIDYEKRASLCAEHYSKLESDGLDVLMLGADNVSTLRKTHGSWFNREEELILEFREFTRRTGFVTSKLLPL